MKITVCQLHDSTSAFASDWAGLVAHVRQERSDLVLLPDMPFHPWLAAMPVYDFRVWGDAVAAHERWEHRLDELSPAVVLGSRPVDFGNERFDAGYVWTSETGASAAHVKAYLPNEDGLWEASWYNRAVPEFIPARAGEARVGFLIGTELWALDQAKLYGEEGVQALVTPRSTPASTLDKWLAGGRAAAIVSGAFSLSSNRYDESGAYGGQGWIISPDGDVLGLTSPERPFVSEEIDLALADQAKATYPRYAVFEMSAPRAAQTLSG